MKHTKAPTKAKAVTVTAITPASTVHFDHLREPDTEGQYATGKYTAKISFVPDPKDPDFQKFKAACDELSEELYGRTGVYPWTNGDHAKSADYAGTYVLTPKSNFAPRVYLEDGELHEGHVGREAIVKIECELVGHNAGGAEGIAARISSVLLLEQGTAGGANKPSAFAKGKSPNLFTGGQPPREVPEARDASPQDIVNRIKRKNLAA